MADRTPAPFSLPAAPMVRPDPGIALCLRIYAYAAARHICRRTRCRRARRCAAPFEASSHGTFLPACLAECYDKAEDHVRHFHSMDTIVDALMQAGREQQS